MPRGILVTLTECSDLNRELEWNRWYSHTHIPDLSKAKGFVRARRYRSTDPNAAHKHHVVYEFDSPDLLASYNDLLRLALEAYRAGRVIDCNKGWGTDSAATTRGVWEEIDLLEFKPLERHDYPRTGKEATFGPIEERLRAAGIPTRPAAS